MKDDLFNKLKSILSGSIQLEKTPDENITDRNLPDEDLVNSFMNQILDAAWVEEDLKKSCAPSYHLCNKEKHYWLLNTQMKTFMQIRSGVEIIPIETGKNNTVCLIGQSTYSVPNEILICSGWN